MVLWGYIYAFSAFYVTDCPSLQGPSTLPCKLLPELQRNKDTVRYAVLGAEGSRTVSRTTDANLESWFIQRALVFVFPKIGGVAPPSPFTTWLYLV